MRTWGFIGMLGLGILGCSGGPGSGDDTATPTEEGVPSGPVEAWVRGVALEGAGLYPDNQSGVTGLMEGGDLVVASLGTDDKGYASGTVVVRMTPEGEPVWASRLSLGYLPRSVAILGDRVFVASDDQYPGNAAILILSADDGSLIEAHGLGAVGEVALTASAGGRLLLSTANLLARLDPETLALDFVYGAKASRVIEVEGGYVVGSVNLKANMTGALLRGLDSEGAPLWESFISPGPGTHILGGMRALSGGGYQVFLSNDSTRSDNFANTKPLVVGILDAEGRPTALKVLALGTTDQDGYPVPLQFGAIRDVYARSGETWLGLLANSGGFGSDIRGRVLVKVGEDGALSGLSFGGVHVRPSPDGAALVVNAEGGTQLTVTRVDPRSQSCAGAPTGNLSDIDFVSDFEGPDALSAGTATLVLTPLSVEVTALGATATEICAEE